MEKTSYNPKQFADEMKAILDKNSLININGPCEYRSIDHEEFHSEADDLLIKTLRSLGFNEGCDIYESVINRVQK